MTSQLLVCLLLIKSSFINNPKGHVKAWQGGRVEECYNAMHTRKFNSYPLNFELLKTKVDLNLDTNFPFGNLHGYTSFLCGFCSKELSV